MLLDFCKLIIGAKNIKKPTSILSEGWVVIFKIAFLSFNIRPQKNAIGTI